MAVTGDVLKLQEEIAGKLTLSLAVGGEFRALRERCAFTQDQLSRLLEVRRETLSRIESGHLPANLSVIQRFSAVVALWQLAREEAARAEVQGRVADAAYLDLVAKGVRLPRDAAQEVVLAALTSYDRKRQGLLQGLEG